MLLLLTNNMNALSATQTILKTAGAQSYSLPLDMNFIKESGL